MLTLLKRVFAPVPEAPASHVVVTVFSRAGCGCCDKAMVVLEESRRRHGFAIETVDVDSDPGLKAEHGMHVPVVAVDGKVRFRGLVNPALLERVIIKGAESSRERP